ncbi:MAG: MBL fold metallo-hydrolase [Phycisphaerae bacterium]
MLRIGRWEIRSVVNGTIRLDGGAMFGVVPKVLWAPRADVDDQNRILLATRTVLAIDRERGRVVLVDTGCGSKWSRDKAARYGIRVDLEAIPAALAEAGFSESDVTDVVISHLHFDHNGGLTDWTGTPGGPTRWHYPQARHWIHRGHWDHAHAPHRKDRPSFLKEDFSVLRETDRLRFVEGDGTEADADGLRWFVSHGHTPHQLHPIFEGDDAHLLFAGDIVPTSAHLGLGWVMAYDVEPMRTIEEKRMLFERCLEERTFLAFPHDPSIGGVVLAGSASRPEIGRTLDL